MTQPQLAFLFEIYRPHKLVENLVCLEGDYELAKDFLYFNINFI